MKIGKKLVFVLGIIAVIISVPSTIFLTRNIENPKSVAYKRTKKLLKPDLYLIYRITERILEANNIKRPIRIAVRKGVNCSGTSGLAKMECSANSLLPDIDKSTNFDIWASQVINTMAGQANAFAMSDNGTLIVNNALLKELMGRPEQLACVISHELAHITQNHSEEERKASRKYDAVAALRISERAKQLHNNQTGAYVMLGIMGAMSDSYSGTNTSLNQLSTQIALNNLASQMLSPQVTEMAMEYSPVIGDAINEMKGLSPSYMTQAFSSIDSYLRDAALSLAAFNRGQEYEADLIGTQYAATAGFDEKECLKLWTETMPHNTDKIVARLLPQGIPDPGKKEPEIFVNKEEKSDLEKKYKGHPKCSTGEWGERHPKCRAIAKTKNKIDDKKISEQTLELLRTHPSDERRAKNISEHIKNKKLFEEFRSNGKNNKLKDTMRDWSYDKDSDSLVISDFEKDPEFIGLEQTGTTGINIDEFLE